MSNKSYSTIHDYLRSNSVLSETILGVFNPSSLTVYHNFNAEEALEAQELFNQIESISDDNLRKAFVKQSKEKVLKYADLLSTTFHEEFHAWQFTSTPFGLEMSSLDLFQTGSVLNTAFKIVNEFNQNVKIPLKDWMNEVTDGKIKQYLQFKYQMHTNLELVKEYLIGANFGPAEAMSNIFVALHKEIAKRRTDRSCVPPFPEGFNIGAIRPKNPSIPLFAGGTMLGALHICEGNAITYENIMSQWIFEKWGLHQEVPLVKRWRNNELPDRYKTLWVYTVNKLAGVFSPAEVTRIMSIASDLALLTPLEQHYFPLCKELNLKWEDLDPGWRYIRAILLLKDLKTKNAKLPDVMTEEPDIGYEDLTTFICNAFGWPSPKVIAQIGASMKDNHRNDLFIDTYALGCQLRLKHPSLFAFPSYGNNRNLLHNDFHVKLNMTRPGWSADQTQYFLGATPRASEKEFLLFLAYYRSIIAQGMMETHKVVGPFEGLKNWDEEIHPVFFKKIMGFPIERVESLPTP